MITNNFRWSIEGIESVTLTPAQFAALPEYSCSIPTATTIGKKWKYNHNAYRPGKLPPEWYQRTYAEHDPPRPDSVRIITEKILPLTLGQK